jgi:hypothetical protein
MFLFHAAKIRNKALWVGMTDVSKTGDYKPSNALPSACKKALRRKIVI